MRKTILLAAILIAGLSAAQAQEKAETTTESGISASTILKVHLHNFMSIAINSDDAYVDLEYKTADDYDGTGVSALKEDHLIVSSLSPFIVKVNSSTTSPINADGIALKADGTGIKIKVEKGTSRGMVGSIANAVTLRFEGDDIIDSDVASLNNTFNITYSGEGDGAYRNKYFGDGDPVVYTTNVIYTITSK
jgi:hypothetical protein